jgi:hypothetical protein
MRRLVHLFAVFALLSTVGQSEATPISVSADATVVGGLFADVNFGSEDFRGGLLTGLDGSTIFGPYRFYLSFTLPNFTPGTFIASATLQGFYNDDWDTFDDRGHSFYQALSTWTESAITWNNQPGSIGGPLGTFNPALGTPGTLQSWNVTAPVNDAYLADTLLYSVLFRADDESPGAGAVLNNNLEYFASREFMGGAHAFRIDVEVATVPEPGTLLLLGIGVAAAMRNRQLTVRKQGALWRFRIRAKLVPRSTVFTLDNME